MEEERLEFDPEYYDLFQIERSVSGAAYLRVPSFGTRDNKDVTVYRLPSEVASRLIRELSE